MASTSPPEYPNTSETPGCNSKSRICNKRSHSKSSHSYGPQYQTSHINIKHLLSFRSQDGLEVSKVRFHPFLSNLHNYSFPLQWTVSPSQSLIAIYQNPSSMWRAATPTRYNATTHVLNIVAAKDFDMSVHLTVSSKLSYTELEVLIYTKYRQTFSILYVDQTLHGPNLCFVSRITLQENPAKIDRLIIEKCVGDPTAVTRRSLTASAPRSRIGGVAVT